MHELYLEEILYNKKCVDDFLEKRTTFPCIILNSLKENDLYLAKANKY